MKLPFLVSSTFLALATADHLDDDLFSFVTFSDTWETCGLTAATLAHFPIEVAACEADLVVYGRVLAIEDDGAVKITVEYQSRLFSQPRKKIPKYGAGLDNQVNGTDFYDDSGFFTTHVTTGFMPPDTRFSDPPCGTILPRPQDELYFFLKALPENEGVVAGVDEQAVLTVNLTLSTTVLRSGTAPSDAWDYVEEGIFNDEIKLSGDCQAVYCCYNPDCADCEGVLEKYPGFDCPEWTVHEDEDDGSGANSVMASSVVTTAAAVGLGFVAQLF
eukprot:CAMPEP_0117028538 /NCGR_PEP_ID=MMETSP0472-20121206/20742_1 /TAXON_ID=693140 ORGANISM="Tiarina fusus, Strain LIS" /NCGR_SAMPLE_ID=MMETSP0472 /ASSEMBLY_ACC=CAM_ASM_000603 /LENGTH=272 /DNA_ID=CAMNT_0004736055 /DNA_START=99 /DNA_END=918 /DNA_ORIENTATION=-